MNPLSTLLQGYEMKTVKSRRSERGDQLDYFTEKINASRVSTPYKPLTKANMAHILSIYTTEQLYLLRIKTDKAKNFSATFWYYVKPKKK